MKLRIRNGRGKQKVCQTIGINACFPVIKEDTGCLCPTKGKVKAKRIVTGMLKSC